MDALGRLFDIGLGWAPVDLDTANGATGKRISMQGARGITFVVALGVGAADDLVLNVRQHTAYTGGTSSDLDSAAITDTTGPDRFYIKSEALLDNDETWVKVTHAAASEATLVGATYGDKQNIVVIEVDARQLGAGYTHVSLDAATTTAAAHLGVCLYFLHELRFQRKPASLPNLLRPGVANA
jgi:hypothetical protein